LQVKKEGKKTALPITWPGTYVKHTPRTIDHIDGGRAGLVHGRPAAHVHHAIFFLLLYFAFFFFPSYLFNSLSRWTIKLAR
jgi:hypothetical protein